MKIKHLVATIVLTGVFVVGALNVTNHKKNRCQTLLWQTSKLSQGMTKVERVDLLPLGLVGVKREEVRDFGVVEILVNGLRVWEEKMNRESVELTNKY